MNFFEHLIFPPRAEHLHLAKYFLISISLIFVPFISMLFGATVLSVIFNLRARNEANELWNRFSVDLMQTFGNNFFLGLALGVLPLFTISISYTQLLYGTELKIAQYLMYALIFITVGVVFAYLYKRNIQVNAPGLPANMITGGIAIVFLLLGFYVFVNSTGIIFDPEKWPHIRSAFPILPSAGIFARFLYFFHFTFALTGAGILFFYLHWMGGKPDISEEYRLFLKKFGSALSLVFTLMLPVLFLWHLRNMPQVASSTLLYELTILSFVVLFVIAYLLYDYLTSNQLKHGVPIFIFFILYLLVINFFDSSAMGRAMFEHNIVLEKQAQAIRSELESRAAEMRPGKVEPSIELGANIFNTRCIACHRFDQKLVGPAYKDVLPKYENNQAALIEFILNPVKINPDFPPMPNQGLKPAEAEAVARYLMDRYHKEFSK